MLTMLLAKKRKNVFNPNLFIKTTKMTNMLYMKQRVKELTLTHTHTHIHKRIQGITKNTSNNIAA